MNDGRVMCPCCQQVRDFESETALPLIQATRAANQHNLQFGDKWLFEPAKRHELFWACNECLSSRRAEEADLDKQGVWDTAPCLAYFDRQYNCEDCQRSFNFTASEQKYWYEDLNFNIASIPKQCADCRRKRRDKSALQIAYKELYQNHDDESLHDQIELLKLAAKLKNTKRFNEHFYKARHLAVAQGVFENRRAEFEAARRDLDSPA